MERPVLVIGVTIANKIFPVDNIRECLYPTLHERKTLLPNHHAIAGCVKGIPTKWFIHQASIMIQARWLFLSSDGMDIPMGHVIL